MDELVRKLIAEYCYPADLIPLMHKLKELLVPDTMMGLHRTVDLLFCIHSRSGTTPELILKMPNGVILAPVQIGFWLVVFCDEINLPAPDKYSTQKVISFICQLVECGGYWHASDMAWVKLEHVQFVGGYNPPTDPG